MDLVQVIILVSDLASAQESYCDMGLTVAPGGRHPGRGTANLIVPLGSCYVELLAVVDRDEAAASPLGRPVLSALASRGPGPARWSVIDPSLGSTAARLGLPVESRSRTLPSGHVVSWEAVGVDAAWESPWLCAFMWWPSVADQPGRMPAWHPCGATGISVVEVGVPSGVSLSAWAGAVPPSVSVVRGGMLGPRSVVLSTPTGELTIA